MEINYKLILKYLSPDNSINKENINSDENKVNESENSEYHSSSFLESNPKSKSSDFIKNENNSNFITKKNLYNYSTNFPLKFQNIFSDKYYRFGITVFDNNNNNISFWSSLLTLIDIDKKFIIPYENDEINIINNFKNELIDKYSKKGLSACLKKFDKNDIKERIKLIPDYLIIQYIVDIININIFILDFKTETINIIYNEIIMNPLKPTIILANFDFYWEPIILNKKSDNQKIFNYNDSIIKKLLNNDIKYYEESKLNKHFNCDSPKNIIINENNKLSIINSKNDALFVEPSEEVKIIENIPNNTTDNEEFKNLNKTKLNKMKLDDLIILLKKINNTIDINNKKSKKKMITKKELIELILNQFN